MMLVMIILADAGAHVPTLTDCHKLPNNKNWQHSAVLRFKAKTPTSLMTIKIIFTMISC